MGTRLTLVLGGARSGKSTYAEQLAHASGQPVTYVATAQAWDEEMAARIVAHQAQRPADWTTVEAPLAVGQAIAAADPTPVVLIDCLTLLANNVLGALLDAEDLVAAEAALRAEVDGLLAVYAEHPGVWIVVSNEVGLGIVPAYPLGRVYRDVLGRANQRLAAAADEVVFMVAGLPLKVK